MTRASSVTTYIAKRAGRSVVTSEAITVGAAEASIARTAVAREDRMSLMVYVGECDEGLFRIVPRRGLFIYTFLTRNPAAKVVLCSGMPRQPRPPIHRYERPIYSESSGTSIPCGADYAKVGVTPSSPLESLIREASPASFYLYRYVLIRQWECVIRGADCVRP